MPDEPRPTYPFCISAIQLRCNFLSAILRHADTRFARIIRNERPRTNVSHPGFSFDGRNRARLSGLTITRTCRARNAHFKETRNGASLPQQENETCARGVMNYTCAPGRSIRYFEHRIATGLSHILLLLTCFALECARAAE